MGTTEIIITVILFLIAIGSCVISYFQFNEKGVLFSNSYLYASIEERKKMDKKPHYKQSGVVFAFIGILFFINAIEMIMKTNWLFYVVLIFACAVIIYAIISSIKIKNK